MIDFRYGASPGAAVMRAVLQNVRPILNDPRALADYMERRRIGQLSPTRTRDRKVSR